MNGILCTLEGLHLFLGAVYAVNYVANIVAIVTIGTSLDEGRTFAGKSAGKPKAAEAVPAKAKKPEYKSGWAKPKPKKNARPVKKGGKK